MEIIQKVEFSLDEYDTVVNALSMALSMQTDDLREAFIKQALRVLEGKPLLNSDGTDEK